MDTEDYTQIKGTASPEGFAGIHTSYQTVLTLHFIEGYDYEEL